MITFIVVLHIVVSLMLIAAVLIQSGKGTGFAEVFGMGGGMGQSLFGVQTGSFLTRLTTVLAILFMITSLSLALFMGYERKSVVERMAGEEKQEETLPVGGVGMVKPEPTGEKSGEKKYEERREGKTSGDEGIQDPSEESR